MKSLLGLDPATYEPHPVHRGGRTYTETNCYADIVVELVHARGLEPLAAMGFCVRADFEGDQWTFFKPPPGDLEALFAIDIHEMQPYRALPDQIVQQLDSDRTILVELDAWYLPDTAATSYRTEHVKTSAAIEAIDVDAQRLRYFHNAGLYELAGEDFRGALRLDVPVGSDRLPPYCELVRFDAGEPLTGDALRAAARDLLGGHLARRPASNPFDRFAARLDTDLPDLLAGDAALYHAYAFATVRMVGSAFELLAAHVDWLLGAAGAPATESLGRIVDATKVLSFRLARRRPFTPGPHVEAMAGAWDEATAALETLVG